MKRTALYATALLFGLAGLAHAQDSVDTTTTVSAPPIVVPPIQTPSVNASNNATLNAVSPYGAGATTTTTTTTQTGFGNPNGQSFNNGEYFNGRGTEQERQGHERHEQEDKDKAAQEAKDKANATPAFNPGGGDPSFNPAGTTITRNAQPVTTPK